MSLEGFGKVGWESGTVERDVNSFISHKDYYHTNQNKQNDFLLFGAKYLSHLLDVSLLKGHKCLVTIY